MSSGERDLDLDEEIGYRIRGDDTDAFLEEYRDGRWYEAREPLGPRPEPTVAEVLLCAKAQELAAEVARLREENDELRFLINDEMESRTEGGARLSETEWEERAEAALEGCQPSEVAQLRQALSRLITATSNLSVGADAEWHRDPGTVEWREAFHAARAALGVSRPDQEQDETI